MSSDLLQRPALAEGSSTTDNAKLGRGITASPNFLADGGEMGALMRAKSWGGTPLGPPEIWPDALKMVVSICLNSRFPISLWWGPELVMLYDDAWRPIFGKTKHPTWGRSVQTGHPFVSGHRLRQRLLRPDADNDAMIGPGVVGQTPIGSNVAHAGTMGADPATIPI